MTAQEELNYQLYLVTRRPGLPPLAGRKEAMDAATQDARDLLARGADANYSQGTGEWTVLDSAISSGNADIVQLLLDHGAKVTPRTVLLVGGTVERAHASCAETTSGPDPWDLASIFKQAAAARDKIAELVFEKAAKKDFVGKNRRRETVLDLIEASPAATAELQKAMKKHGLTKTDLSYPKFGRAKNFIGKIFKGPGR